MNAPTELNKCYVHSTFPIFKCYTFWHLNVDNLNRIYANIISWTLLSKTISLLTFNLTCKLNHNTCIQVKHIMIFYSRKHFVRQIEIKLPHGLFVTFSTHSIHKLCDAFD